MQKKTFNFLINGILKEMKFPAIMGIVNLTPDSFYKESQINEETFLIEKVENMITNGANIIDLGAISTRPNANLYNIKEELNRLLYALKIIRKKFPDILISIDTFRSEIARISYNEGANIINDISGGTMDSKMFETMAKIKLPYILMHIQGTPKNMQNNPIYNNVINDINFFLGTQIEKANYHGIYDIIIDPGFGFGKTIEHNFEILKNLDLLKIHNRPILVGLSRKSMIYKPLNIKPEDSLTGTIALNTIALLKGVSILRVHDVKETKQIIQLLNNLYL